ncbi:hypothetical protein OGATHE_004307 [Ogataea polymorpha]|uniref:Uncharacterized protein n=1 Tax=Ogataea polymorpha TaxID=460523 RepID=A0A9P8T1N9_9ASCO|nr:hypothetical protein OGATHE_004307 [Ogataea polymorpha]
MMSSNFPLARPLDLPEEPESTDGRSGLPEILSIEWKPPDRGRLGDLAGMVKFNSVYCSLSGTRGNPSLSSWDGRLTGMIWGFLILSLSSSSITGDVSFKKPARSFCIFEPLTFFTSESLSEGTVVDVSESLSTTYFTVSMSTFCTMPEYSDIMDDLLPGALERLETLLLQCSVTQCLGTVGELW